MTTTQHTAGPWKVNSPKADVIIGDDYFLQYRSATNNDMFQACPESHANARLIAAAPELLEALGALLDATLIGNPDISMHMVQARELALKAINKATGAK